MLFVAARDRMAYPGSMQPQFVTASPSKIANRPVPRAAGFPLVGALPQVLRDPPRELMRIAQAHPRAIVRVPFGPVDTYLVTHPPHVEHVLQGNWRNYGKGKAMWSVVRRMLGNGLIVAEGDAWVRARRLLQPLFGQKHLASLANLMVGTIDRSLRVLADAPGPVDMEREMCVLAQNVVLEAIFGVSVEREETANLATAFAVALREINLRLFVSVISERLPLPGEEALRRALLTMDAAMERILRERQEKPQENRKDLLALLLAARDPETGEPMADREIRDELLTLWAAGNETTATAMTWVCHVLDKYPEVDARFRAEVTEVLGDRLPTYDDLARMPYGKMVIQEAMRLYPPSWILPRQSIEPDVIDGYFVPGGSTILMSQYIMHRDPAYWENPEVFDPERFTPERIERRHRCAFMPFGTGPRICLGMAFSLMEAQLALSMIVQRFRPRLVPGHEPLPISISTLRPRGGMPMTLEHLR